MAFWTPSQVPAGVGCAFHPDVTPRSSAVSAFMHRCPIVLHGLWEEDPSAVYLCTPVAGEIWFGLSRLEADSRRRRLLTNEFRRLCAVLRCADWSEPASSFFGQWKAALQQRGALIEDMDLAIASIALSLPARLASCNMRHFARIDDLKLVDWSEPKHS